MADPLITSGTGVPSTPAIRERDLAELCDVLADLSDGTRLRRALRECVARLGQEFSSPLISLCSYRPEERRIEGLHYHVGEPVAVTRGFTADGTVLASTAELDRSMWRRVAITEPAELTREFMERHAYPRATLLDWYAQFDYRGWVEVPICAGGRVPGKVSLMHAGHAAAAVAAGVRASETFRRLKTLWLAAKGIERLRGCLIEAERDRLACDLHDALMQPLTGILLEAEVAEEALSRPDRAAVRHLHRLRQFAAESLTETRRVVAGLQPERTKRGGLVAALESLAERSSVAGRIDCRLERPRGELPPLDPWMRAEVYRIAQEAVTNAIRHGGATEVRVHLESRPRALRLRVVDNGGLHPVESSPGAGNGRRSMARRAARLGASIAHRLGGPRGTEVRVCIPVRAEIAPPDEGRTAKTAQAIRVLLVDDHRVILEGLAAVLEPRPDIRVVGQVTRGREVPAAVRAGAVDVVVLDVQMPEVDGLEVIRRLQADRPATRILVLTAFGNPELIAHCTEAGARGFLLKGSGSRELLAAIRKLHAGGTYFGAGVIDKIGSVMRLPRFSPREAQILPLVAAGLVNKEIAARLRVSEETVKDRLRTLFKKFDVHSRMELVARAAAMGLLRELPIPEPTGGAGAFRLPPT